jgi:hypothetical protein
MANQVQNGPENLNTDTASLEDVVVAVADGPKFKVEAEPTSALVLLSCIVVIGPVLYQININERVR